MDKIRGIMVKIGKVMKTSCNSMSDFFKIVGKQIKEFTSHWKDLDHLDLDTLRSMLLDFKETVIDEIFDFSKAEESLNSFGNTVRDFFTNFSSKISVENTPFMASIVNAFSSIKNYIGEKIGINDIFTAIIAGVDVYAITKMIKLLGNFADLTGVLKKLGDAITGTFTSITKYFKSLRMAANVKTIMYIAIALGILTASLIALAYVPLDRLDGAMKRLAELALILAGLAIAVGLMNKLSAGSSGLNAIGLVGLAVAIVILSKVVKSLAEMPWKDALRGIGELTLLALSLIAVSALLQIVSRITRTSAMSMLGLIGLALSMRIMIDNIALMQEKLNGLDIGLFFKQLLAVFSGFATVSLAAIPFAANWKAGFGMLAAVLALHSLVNAIDKIINLDVSNIKKNIGSFIVVFGMLATLLAITRLAGKNAQSGGAAILMLSVSLLIIVEVIKAIANVSQHDLGKGLGVISMLMLVMGAVIALSHFAGKDAAKAGIMLILMSVAIAILVGCMYLLSILAKDQASMKLAMAAIGEFGAIIAAILMVSRYAGQSKGTLGVLIVLTSFIAIMAGALYILSSIDNKDGLKQATASMAILMAMFSVMELVSGKARISKSAVLAMASMLGVIAVLAGILALMSKIDMKDALKNAKALSMLLVSFSAAMLIVSKIGPMAHGTAEGALEAAAVVGIIASVLALVGGLVALIPGAQKFFDDGVGIIRSIGEALGAFLGGIIGGGMVSLSEAFITVVENFKIACEGLAEIGNNAGILEGIATLAEVILAFTVSEFLDGLAKLIGLGESDLGDFAEEIKTFANVIAEFQNVGSDKVECAKMVAEAGRALIEFAQDVPNAGGALGFIVGNNDQLGTFGVECKKFADQIKLLPSIDADKLTTAETIRDVGKALIEFAQDVPNAGGALGFIVGNNDQLGTFGEECKKFADKITSFPSVGKGMVTSSENVRDVGKALIDFAKYVPNSGGVAAFFAGDNDDLSNFGGQCKKFAEKLEAMPNIGSDKITTAQNIYSAGEELIEFVDDISDYGSDALDWISKDKNSDKLTTLAKKCKKFAEKLAEMPTLNTVNADTVSNMAEMYDALVGLADDAYYDEDTLAWIKDNAKTLTGLADGVKGFASSLSGLPIIGEETAKSGDNLAHTGETLLAFVKTLFGDSSIVDQVIENDSLNKFASSIEQSVPSFVSMGSALDEIDFGSISEDVAAFSKTLSEMLDAIHSINGNESTALAQLTESFSEFGKNGVTAFSQGMTLQSDGTIVEAINKMMTTALKSIQNQYPKFKNSGKTLVERLRNGVKSYSAGNVTAAFTNTLSSAVNSIRSYYNSFYNAGVYLVQGYINGMRSKTAEANMTGYNLGKSTAENINKGQKSASPSKLSFQSGEWLGEGYVNGIKSYWSVAATTAEYLASNSISSMADALYSVSSVVGENLEFQPTITPIIDTTSISSGFSLIDTKFSSAKAMALSGSISGEVDANQLVLDYISNLDKANTRRSNDVVSALRDLQRDFQSLGDRIDNIEMVMDSGEVVGALTTKFDRSLGRQVSRRNRGI